MASSEEADVAIREALSACIKPSNQKPSKSSLDRMWEILKNKNPANVVKIITSYEQLHDGQIRCSWLETLEYLFSKKDDNLKQSLDNSTLTSILKKIVSEDTTNAKQRALLLISTVTRKCQPSHVKNFYELRKKIEGEKIANMIFYDSVESEYFSSKLKLTVKDSSPIVVKDSSSPHSQTHLSIKDSLHPTINNVNPILLNPHQAAANTGPLIISQSNSPSHISSGGSSSQANPVISQGGQSGSLSQNTLHNPIVVTGSSNPSQGLTNAGTISSTSTTVSTNTSISTNANTTTTPANTTNTANNTTSSKDQSSSRFERQLSSTHKTVMTTTTTNIVRKTTDTSRILISDQSQKPTQQSQGQQSQQLQQNQQGQQQQPQRAQQSQQAQPSQQTQQPQQTQQAQQIQQTQQVQPSQQTQDAQQTDKSQSSNMPANISYLIDTVGTVVINMSQKAPGGSATTLLSSPRHAEPKIIAEHKILSPGSSQIKINMTAVRPTPISTTQPTNTLPTTQVRSPTKMVHSSMQDIKQTANLNLTRLTKLEQNLYETSVSNPESFISNYKKLKMDIWMVKDELSKVFRNNSKNDVDKELTKFLIGVNNSIRTIEENIRSRKKELADKGGLASEHMKVLQSLAYFKHMKSLKNDANKNSLDTGLSSFLLTLNELLEFKTQPCANPVCPDKLLLQEKGSKDFRTPNCPFYHGQADRRRPPFVKAAKEPTFFYTNKLICRDCLDSDTHDMGCYYCKNYYEFFFHPVNYKLKRCTSGNCISRYCPFFHTDEEKQEWEETLEKAYQCSRTGFKHRSIVVMSTKAFEPLGFFGMHAVKRRASEGPHTITHPKDVSPGIGTRKVVSPTISKTKEKTFESQPQQSQSPQPQQSQSPKPQQSQSPQRQLQSQKEQAQAQTQAQGQPQAQAQVQTQGQPQTQPQIQQEIKTPSQPQTQQQQLQSQPQMTAQEQMPEGITGFSEENPGEDGSYFYVKYKQLTLPQNHKGATQLALKVFNGPCFKITEFKLIYKLICGFLNMEGGMIMIGVDDVTQCVLGIEMSLRDYEEMKLRIVKALKERFLPSVSETLVKMKRLPVIQSESELEKISLKDHLICVIKIDVMGDLRQCYQLKSVQANETTCKGYRRVEGNTKGMSNEEFEEMIRAKSSRLRKLETK